MIEAKKALSEFADLIDQVFDDCNSKFIAERLREFSQEPRFSAEWQRCSADSAEEKMPVTRPVAFRVPRVVNDRLSKTEFRLFDDEDEARRAACDIGADYDGLFLVADRRAAFFAQPHPSTAPQAMTRSEFVRIGITQFKEHELREIVATFCKLPGIAPQCQAEIAK